MQSLLEGVTVLDLGPGRAANYCTRLMAQAGARVIVVERPGVEGSLRTEGPFAPDDDAHSFGAAFAFLNTGKESVAADYGTAGGAALLWELIAHADILVEDFAPGTLAGFGFSTAAMLARQPALVHVSISNFGASGPLRDLPATELTLQASSGLMDLNGEAEREPLRYPGNLARHWAGANAAQAALIAYWHALMTGEGQHVDVSIQESLAATWWMHYAEYQYTGSLFPRGYSDLLSAEDGQLMALPVTTVTWEEYALAFDAVELALDESFKPGGANAEQGSQILAGHLATNTRAHWFQRCIEHEIPAGMMQSLEEIAHCPQLAARGFFDDMAVGDGRVVPVPGQFWTVEGHPNERRAVSAPAHGQHDRAEHLQEVGR